MVRFHKKGDQLTTSDVENPFVLKLGATPVTLTSAFCLGKYLVSIVTGMSIGNRARRDGAEARLSQHLPDR